jgi:hypothetical protein
VKSFSKPVLLIVTATVVAVVSLLFHTIVPSTWSELTFRYAPHCSRLCFDALVGPLNGAASNSGGSACAEGWGPGVLVETIHDGRHAGSSRSQRGRVEDTRRSVDKLGNVVLEKSNVSEIIRFAEVLTG